MISKLLCKKTPGGRIVVYQVDSPSEQYYYLPFSYAEKLQIEDNYFKSMSDIELLLNTSLEVEEVMWEER